MLLEEEMRREPTCLLEEEIREPTLLPGMEMGGATLLQVGGIRGPILLP